MIDRDEFLMEIEEEKRLRTALRGLLKEYFKEKKERQTAEENNFRNIIRPLIKEALSADVADEQPQRSTGINILEELLKNIIAIVEDDYKALTTSQEQRDSFRAHILNAVNNSLKPVEVTMDAESEMNMSNDLEEEVDVAIDVEEDKFIPVRDRDQTTDDIEEEEEEAFQDIEDMDKTGRNFASITFNKIENQILDSYESLADKQDRQLFHDYLLTNLKLYFDRFEDELYPSETEPESPDYAVAKDVEVDAGELGL